MQATTRKDRIEGIRLHLPRPHQKLFTGGDGSCSRAAFHTAGMETRALLSHISGAAKKKAAHPNENKHLSVGPGLIRAEAPDALDWSLANANGSLVFCSVSRSPISVCSRSGMFRHLEWARSLVLLC